ncbi:MAG: hypothetical protein HY046_02075 [Acidobacteria bacterium]|nr:hypothetical protein [Acidobacteriota bacterium]
MYPDEKKEFPWAPVAGALILLFLLGGAVVISRVAKTGNPAGNQKLPFGAAESAYTARIEFKEIKMSRAANLLNQEITFIFGVVANNGTQPIRDMEVNVEFKDVLNQVVLRETFRPLNSTAPSGEPLLGGHSREFQLNLEHVPEEWNRQIPIFRITGLLFE